MLADHTTLSAEDEEGWIEEVPESVLEIRQKALTKRRIIVNEDIDKTAIEKIFMNIEFMIEESDEPIYLLINCDGGCLWETMFLVDYIRECDTPQIVTIGTAKCQSAGFELLISGHYRICYPNTLLMYHDIQCAGMEHANLTQSLSYYKILSDIRAKNLKLIADQSNLTEEFILSQVTQGTDWYITPQQALGYGLIDEIIKLETKSRRLSSGKDDKEA